ncbi:hypothetical protein [Winogradskyella luteola]|uniref:Uncharacterized protein n=1 Tax=Winogradskyella luteola TaxID=2828330 RepID=A0A9X1F6Q4_9FLAO|nr:hypothetical protein [Winogradskyella luteola]MBV7268412.1 hypothetical protein [Winogradskyella luteola]
MIKSLLNDSANNAQNTHARVIVGFIDLGFRLLGSQLLVANLQYYNHLTKSCN